MATEEDEAPQTFEKLSRAQLEIYAKELNEHVRVERHLRLELEGQNQQLEQRVREITALNQLFQRHLDERVAVVKAYKEVIDGLNKIGQEFSALVRRAEEQPLPDLQELPRLGV